MSSVDIRLTSDGILITNGVFDEVTKEHISFTKEFVYAAEFDEITGSPVPMRIPSTNDVLKVSNHFDEVSPTPSYLIATGGTESTITVGDLKYKVHVFTTNGTFTVQKHSSTVEYLIVGGGGGGRIGSVSGPTGFGGRSGFGGQVVSGSTTVSDNNYSIVVGSGGIGLFNAQNRGVDGTPSSALGVTAGGGESAKDSGGNFGGYIQGTFNNITGTSTEYGYTPARGAEPGFSGTAGNPNTGGGGEGGFGNFPGGGGGSGIVIIRYLTL
jgi:hypothetical protein